MRKIKKIKKKATKVKLRFNILFLIVILTIIWIAPVDESYNSVNSPNTKAIKNYKTENFYIDIEGGYLFRLGDETDKIPNHLTIKQIQPLSNLSIFVEKSVKMRVNILNAPKSAILYYNGQPQQLNLYELNRSILSELNNYKKIDQQIITSNRLIYQPKGSYIDLQLKPGINKITIEPPQRPNGLKFAVVSDLHSGYSVGLDAISQIISSEVDFIVINGDIVDYGNKSEYILASALMESLPVPIYTNIGNHEDWQNGKKFYKLFFGDYIKYFEYKNSTFIFADNHTGYIKDEQFNWLNDFLSTNDSTYKFVFTHMPAIDAHTEYFDFNNYRYQQQKHNMYSKPQSDRLISILNRYNVNTLFAGHDHVYNQFNLESVIQANSGALGGKTRDVDDVSYLLVTITDEAINIENQAVNGHENSYNKEHFNRLRTLSLLIKPFVADKKRSLTYSAITIFMFLLIVLIIYYPVLQQKRKKYKSGVKK